MVRFTGGLLLFAAFTAAAPPDLLSNKHYPQQAVIKPPSKAQPKPRKLQGRFLHITDIHPDPFYEVGSDPGEACHHGKGQAGYYGAEVTECDTPFTLVNATFNWIEENLKDQVDFVVWTGDSARHDNDEEIPRSDKQVIKLNRFVVDKFVQVFGKPDNLDDPDPTNDFVVPIVPTFGNNDILPHNIFTPGPNKWTRAYWSIWNKFVPEAQRHSFARGGWFFTEVIPSKLAVFSLNTLYFFDSNSAVDGCDLKSEPGYEHMEWLRIQLQFLRQRGMKAILTGHVPPARTESKQSWDESCYQKYTLWLRQYRDVVIFSTFGHMNLDHFKFQDEKDLKYDFKFERIMNEDVTRSETSVPDTNAENFTMAAKATYLNELRNEWSELPSPPHGYTYGQSMSYDEVDVKKKGKKRKDDEKEYRKFLKAIGGEWGERYSLTLVSPSVVPNFFPTLRIVEYNITGLEDHHPAIGVIGTPAKMADLDVVDALEDVFSNDDEAELEEESSGEMHDMKKKKKKKGKKKKPKKPGFHVPKPPSKSSPPGPGYSPQPLSMISYTQLYANLTKIHEQIGKDKKGADPDKHFEYHVEYTTNDDIYGMKDLTVRSWLDLAERIGRETLASPDTKSVEDDLSVEQSDPATLTRHQKGKSKTMKNHLWKTFIKRAFVHTKPDEDIEQDFG
ncbi:endopolyphosphatase [Exophiala viscosa]|uniref:endopolyphosphatase n=1 Tax=Exophiala viscosa TaxID=2486360 RepID=UPI0021928F97|nr:endopolyphosphatase [Exophiala viscosa]